MLCVCRQRRSLVLLFGQSLPNLLYYLARRRGVLARGGEAQVLLVLGERACRLADFEQDVAAEQVSFGEVGLELEGATDVRRGLLHLVGVEIDAPQREVALPGRVVELERRAFMCADSLFR